jgi:hypothetical protein
MPLRWCDTVAITSSHNIRHSGKFFEAGTVISDSDMDAKSQKRLVDGGVAEYVSVLPGKANEGKPVKKTVKEIEALVTGMGDISEVEKLLEGEDREGAIKAINKRLNELEEEQIAAAVKVINEMTDIAELEQLLANEEWAEVHGEIENRIKELKENA